MNTHVSWWFSCVVFSGLPLVSWAASFTVTTNADSGAGSLRQAILDLNSTGTSSNTISINTGLSAITLASSLPAINKNVTIDGPAATQDITAVNNQVFFINSGFTVSINNIDVSGAKVTGKTGGSGGGGGGGGPGAGAGLFVSPSANVTLSGCTFTSCNATGGTGGAGGGSSGGGGGAGILAVGSNAAGNNGGAGGSASGGGGGGRGGNLLAGGGTAGAAGGAGASAGVAGVAGGLVNGGDGGAGGAGGAYGGGGGGGQGGNGSGLGGTGGDGGAGGAGGFGGGGGGGAGGGTGGTAGVAATGTAGGFGGGTGGNGSGVGTGGGGGGAGLGGAIFVDGTATLTIVTAASASLFSSNSITAGSGGAASGAGTAGSAGSSSGVDLFLTSGGSCTFDIPSGTVILSNPITSNQSGSSGGITKQGVGSLDFATNNLTNTYTGGTTINDGSLMISSNANLGVVAGGLTMNTGASVSPTLTIAGTVTTARATTLTGSNTATVTINSSASLTHSGTIGLGSANLTVNTAGSTSSTLSGLMSGTGGSLTKTGLGTLTVSNGSNSYTGGVTINAGILSVSADVNLGDASGGLTLGGGTLQPSATFSSARTVSLTPATTSTIDTNGNGLTLSGVISNSGALTKQGTGTLTFSGASANTYSGLTTVTVGGLTLNKTAGVNAFGGNVLVNGGTLTLSAASQIPNTSTLTLSSGTFDMGGNAETVDNLVFSGGTLTQGGATLSLASASTALTMRNTTVSGNINLTGGGSVVFDSTNNGTATISGNLDMGTSTISFDIANGSAGTDMSLSGIISNGGVTKISAGTLAFSGASANTYTGLTTVTAGGLTLNKTAGVNALAGNVLINGGTLTLAAANQIPNTSTLTLSSGTFNMGGNAETLDNLVFNGGTLTQGGATLTLVNASTALTMRDTTISGTISLTGGGAVVFDNTNNGTATLSGNLDMGGSTTSFNIANGSASTDMSLSGVISNGAVTKISAGTLAFSGASANTYTGLTTVTSGGLTLNKTAGVNAVGGSVLVNGGTLTLAAANQIPNTATMTLSSGTFDMGGNAETVDNLVFSGGTLTQGGATLTLGNASTALTMRDTTISGSVNLTGGGAIVFDNTNNGTATLSGNLDMGGSTTSFNIANGSASTDMSISGIISNGAITKISAGTLLLSGTSANTYTGLTTVTAGSLTLNKTAGLNAVGGDTLINGGTLTLSAANQISNTGALTLTSGTFDMGGNAETVGSFTYNAGTFTQSGATLSLSSASTALTMRDTTISGTINLTGGGSVVFDATNNGTATISGNLDMGASVTSFDIANGTAGTDMAVSGVVSNGGITKISAGTLSFSGASANTYTGLTTVTAGALTLNKTAGVNAIAGDTLINGGTLTLSAANQISNTGALTLTSGTFDMGGNAETVGSFTYNAGTFTQGGATLSLSSSSTALTVRNTTISGNINLTGGGAVVFDATDNGTGTLSGNLDMGGSVTSFDVANGSAGTDMSLSGVISNGGVTKISAGSLAFSGASANTYTGLTTVTAGGLTLNKTAGVNAIGGSVLINGGTLTLGTANQIPNTSAITLSSGTFDMGGNAETLDNLVFSGGTLTQGGAILTLVNASTALTMRNTTVSGNINLMGGGSVVFDNTNNGTATISGNLDMGGSLTSFDVANGSAGTDMSLSGVISSGGITKISAGTLAFSGASANTYVGLTTVTAGGLILNKTAGVNALAGNVLINGGTLTLGAANQIPNTSTMTLSSGTFDMGGNAETLDNLVFSGGTLTQGGATLTLVNASTALTMRDTTISGTISLTGGGAVVFDNTNNGTATLSGNLDMGGSTISFDIANGSASTDMSLSGVISNGAVTKISAGTLAFSGASANTYTGLTTVTSGGLTLNKTAGVNAVGGSVLVNGGTLTLVAANQIPNTATMTLSSGTFDMGGNAETVDNLVFSGGTLTQGGATLTLGNASTALTMRDTTISGSVNLTGGGAIVFDNTNNGTATLSGNLDMGGSTTSFNIANGSASTDMSISGIISNGAITKISAGTLSFSGASANTYSGLTTVTAGGLTLNKTAGLNAVGGGVLINGGTLTLAAANQIPNTSTMTLTSGTFDMGGNAETLDNLVFSGGTLTQGGATLTLASASTALTMRDTTISGSVNLIGGGAVVFDNTNNGTATLSGNLDMGGSTTSFDIANGSASTDMSLSGVISNGAITKISAGTLAFSGASANIYTGLTTVTAGGLTLNKTAGVNALGGSVLINGGTLTLAAANQIPNASSITLSSGTFDMGGNAETIASLTFSGGTLTQGGATLSLASASTALTMRDTTISGTINLTGGGSVVFDSTNNGTATISGNLDMGTSTTTFDIANGSASTDMSLSGVISNGAVTKISAGTLAFSGASVNTYVGLTTVTAGGLILNKTAGVHALSGNVLINGGTLTLAAANQIPNTSTMTLTSGTFDMGGNAETLDNLVFNAGTLTQGGATLSLASSSTALTMRDTTISGSINLTGGGGVTFDSANNGTATLSGNLDLGGSATLFTIANGTASTDMLISGIVSNGSLVKTGSGTLVLSNASNSYTGGTAINVGVFSASSDGNFGNTAGGITLGGGTLQTSATFSSARAVSLTSLTSSTIDTNGNDLTLSGVISSSGTLTKQGTGTLTFSGTSANTYTGLTTVTAGGLTLNKTAGLNAVGGDTLINGGTLTLSAANQIPNTSTVTLSSGTFAMGGNAETLGRLIFNTGTLTQGGATLSLASASTALTMRDTTISGNVALTGGGSVVFDNTNNGTATLSGNLDMGGSVISFDIANGAAATDMAISGVISNGGITKINAGTLVLSGTSANTYTGLTTVTAGGLTLSKTAGVNAIGGDTLINGGMLTLGAANQISNTGALTLSSGTFAMGGNVETLGSLTYNAGTLTQGGATLGLSSASTALTMRDTAISGNVNLTGGGAVVFDNTNNGTAILSGNLDMGGLTTSFNIANGTAATDMTLSGVISNGAITKTGAGTLELSGASANTYVGMTTVTAGGLTLNKNAGVHAVAGDVFIDGGTLTLGAVGQIPSTSTITLNSGTFDLAGNSESLDNLVLVGGTLIQGGATLTLTELTMTDRTISGNINLTGGGAIVFDSSNNGTATISGNLDMGGSTTSFDIGNGTASIDMSISGIISGGAVTKTGAGTLVFSGTSANTYAGATTVTAGGLTLSKTAGLNAMGGNVLVNGGTLTLSAAGQIPNASTMTLSSGTFDMGGNAETLDNLVFSGGTLTQGGATLSLANASTALTMRDTAVSGNINLTGGGAVVFDSTNNGTATISGNLDMGGSTTSFDIANGSAASDMTLSGIISSGSITKISAGTLTFSGASANTYTGVTTITAGGLTLSKTAGVNALSGNVLINGGTLTLGAANQILNTSTMTLTSGTFNMGGNAETLGSLTFQAGTLTQGGATLSLSSASTALSMRNTTVSGDIALTAGGAVVFDSTSNGTATLSGNLDMGGFTTSFDIANGTAPTDMTISGVITNGGITKISAGTLVLSGTSANTYTGLTTVTSGALTLNKTAGVNAVGGNLLINGGTVTLSAANQISNTSTATLSSGTFDMGGNAETLGSLVYNAGTFTQGGATLSLAGSSTALTLRDTSISGNINLTGGGAVAFDNTNNGTATLSGSLDMGGSITSFNIASGTAPTDMSVSGVISNGGITKASAGTLVLSGASANTYTGLTTVTAGELTLNKTAGVNALAGNVLINGGTLTLAAANQIPNTSSITLSSGTFDMGGNAETLGSLAYNAGTLTQGGVALDLASSGTALSMRTTTISGDINLTGGGAVAFDSTNNGTATISGNLNMGTSTTSFDIASGTASTDMTISGVISNGSVTKTGAGTLLFSGASANTYTGLTTVTGGELTLSKNSGTHALEGSVSINGGTLILGATGQIPDASAITLSSGTLNMGGHDQTLDDIVFNGGTLIHNGATLTLTNSLTPLTMRNTTIPAHIRLTGGGSVVFDSTNNGMATISGNLDMGSSTTIFNIGHGTAPADMLISGIVSNGAVLKTGSGKLVLTGTNSYAGGTVITSGTLQGNTTSLQGAIINNATLVFHQTSAGSYTGSLSGSGDLVKTGIEDLILPGTYMLTGAVTVNEGALVVNGSLAGNNTLTIAADAALRGTGTITKDAVINGRLAPGNSIGTIHLVGSQTFASGSIFEIELNPTDSDLLDIVGSLTIEPGSTLHLLPEPGQYTLPFSYTIIQTTGGVSGMFSTVTSSLPLFTGVVSYSAFDTTIELEAGFAPFASVITEGNAKEVAECLDEITVHPCENSDAIIAALLMLPTVEAIEEALIQMQPSAFTALAIAQENDVLYIKNAVYDRLEQRLHSCPADKQEKHTVWVSALGAHTSQAERDEEPGFIANSPGAFIGVDSALKGDMTLGAGAGYTYTNLNWQQDRGKANIQTAYAALYGRWAAPRVYLFTSLMGGYSFYSIKRHIEFPGVFEEAKSHHNGMGGSAHVKLGLNSTKNRLKVLPFVSVDYLFLHENGFQETGAQSLDLKVESKNSDLLVSEAGFDFSYCIPAESSTSDLFLKLSAIRESRFEGKHEKASMACGCGLDVIGMNPSRTLAGIGAGLNVSFGKNTLALSYQGKFAGGYKDNSLYLHYLLKY